MMKHNRLNAFAVTCLLVAASAAHAQERPVVPDLGKPVPRLDTGPAIPKVKGDLDKFVQVKKKDKKVADPDKEGDGDALPVDGTDTGGGLKGAGTRRRPPGVEGTDVGAEKPVPKWQQGEEKAAADDKPTLSADFIKNCAKLQPGVKVHLDIYDEELESVVKLIACMTGKNIILGKPLKGKKITIYSPTLVSAQEAYRAFLTALSVNGMTVIKKGSFLEIIEIGDAQKSPEMPIREGAMPPAEDRMVTQVITMRHVDAQEVNDVISRLASASAQIIVHAPTNRLIITELGSNLRKLRSFIDQLDVPGGQEQLWIYEVEHAEATDIAQKILEIFEQQPAKGGAAGGAAKKVGASAKAKKAAAAAGAGTLGGAGGDADSASVGESDLDVKVSKVIADERTNRLLIMATERAYRRVKRFIKSIDIPIEGDGQVHIHQLNHAKAADLATVLSNLSQEAKNRANQGAAGGARRPRAAAAAAKADAAGGGADGGSAALFEGEVSVTADEDTNSLVVTSSLKDFLSLKRVIDVLDRPRRQVFIEAVIMEVSVRNQRQFGISGHFPYLDTVGGKDVAFLVNQPNPVNTVGLFQDPSAVAGITGLAAISLDGFDFNGVEIPAFGVVMRALAQSDDVNILSTPHILTTDNEEAELTVGSNVPFIAGVGGGLGGLGGAAGAAGALGGLGLFQNIQRQDVALTLKITPRINAANFVTLEIDQVIEEIESIDPDVGPTTSKRSIKSTVVVKDQTTVVIGGLQKERQLQNKAGFPILSEIPVIGYLFRDNNTEHERRNLLLMLTPHVIEGPADFKAIFERKMEEHREFLARFERDGEEVKLGIDYGKKHGALEAMHQSVEEGRAEQRVLDELKRQNMRPPLPQELDGIDLDEYPKKPKPEAEGAQTIDGDPIDESADAEEDAPAIPVVAVPSDAAPGAEAGQ
jgi:general secretion pathway protein D